MSEGTLSRRLRRASGVAIVALLVSGVGAVYLRQAAEEVTVDDAVAAFRSASLADGAVTATTWLAETPPEGGPAAAPPPAGAGPTSTAPPTTAASTTTPPPQAPAPAPAAPSPAAPPADTIEEGVYAFTTEGYEATNALGGARHDYPKETPVTMRRSDCGWTQRWQPLGERWDESAMCRRDAGLDVQRFTTHHEFFQRSQQQQFDCPAGSSVFRRDAPVGATWSWRCTAGASAIDTVVTVVGPEAVVVGGQEVAATRVHYESKLTGANEGTQVQDRWIRDDGLNLRIKTDIDAQSESPFGVVHYEEHYVITIASLTPRR